MTTFKKTFPKRRSPNKFVGLLVSLCLIGQLTQAQVLKNNDTTGVVVNSPQRNGKSITNYFGSQKGIHETTVLRFAQEGSGMMGIKADNGKWGIVGGNPEIAAGMYINGGGKLPGVGSIELPNGVYIGKQQRRISMLSGPPAEGNRVGAYDNLYMKGDVIFDAEMTNGKNGWRCLDSGGWGRKWSEFSIDAIYVGFATVPDISNGLIYRVIEITNEPNLTTNPKWTTVIGSTFKHGRLTLECFGRDYRKNFGIDFKKDSDYLTTYFRTF